MKKLLGIATSLLALVLLFGCGSTDDTGDDDNGDPRRADATPAEPDAAPTTPDAAPVATADASPNAPDAPPELCVGPGAEGNSHGVGKYCTPGGGECAGTMAPFCTVDFEAGADPFCTTFCTMPDQCGEDATCATEGGQSGCVPNCIL